MTTLTETIEICNRIIDRVETQREIDEWLRQARIEAMIELTLREIGYGAPAVT